MSAPASWKELVKVFGLILLAIGVIGFFGYTMLKVSDSSWDTQARTAVVETASFDWTCPKDKISITAEITDIRAYTLNVCGRSRKYRNFGTGGNFRFIDVTDNVQPVVLPPGGDDHHLLP